MTTDAGRMTLAGSMPGDFSEEEVTRLRGCLGDLVGITALPALWKGGEPSLILDTSLDALVGMLDAAFVFARLNDPQGGPPIEVGRIAKSWEAVLRTGEIGRVLDSSLAAGSHSPPSVIRVEIGDTRLSVATARLGLQGDIGTILVGSERSDFPEQTERLILDVAANQAALGLQQARLSGEQRCVAADLDEHANELNFQLTVDSIPGMVHTMTPAGGVEFVNRQILDYFGKTLEELNNWGELLHPDDRARIIGLWTRSVATGEPYDAQHRVLRADGTYGWLHSRGLPLRDGSGNIVRWYNLLTDIDERKRAEDALAASERNLKLTIDTIPALVWSPRPDGRAEFFNEHYIEFTGLSAEQASGWGWTRAVHPEDLDDVSAWWQHVLAAGAPGEIEARLRRRDGASRWFLHRANPLRDESGEIVKWYGVSTDIEDRKEAEQELRRSETFLAQAQRLTLTGSLWWKVSTGEITWSDESYRLMGYPTTVKPTVELILNRVHPEDFALVRETVERSAREGSNMDFEHRLLMPDGSVKHVHVVVQNVSGAGRPPEFAGAVSDITERKRVEAELRRSEAFLAEAQQISRLGSFSYLEATGVIVWSEEVYRIFEVDRDTRATFEVIRARIHPEDLAAFDAEIVRSHREGNDSEFNVRLLMPDQTVKYIYIVSHCQGGPGQLEFSGAIQDVTQRRLSEEALAKVRSELASVARVTSLGVLTASIAHEVNQPLAGIVTNASTCLRMLAANPPDIDGARETARRTVRDGNRAADVIARLRSLFNKKEFRLESLELNEATREVIALSLSDLQRQRVILQSELADDLPLITGDRIQLQQVMLNLIRNASDAMADVYDRPRLLLIKTEREDDNRVRLSVRDAGMGVQVQRPESLFEAFYTTKSGGMGIGLFVSRSIIERHQGRLWAERNDGPGTTFFFSVPFLTT